MKNTSVNVVQGRTVPKKQITGRLLIFSLLIGICCIFTNCKKDYLDDFVRKGNTIRNPGGGNGGSGGGDNGSGRDTSSNGSGNGTDTTGHR
jgi:hypothetical protein